MYEITDHSMATLLRTALRAILFIYLSLSLLLYSLVCFFLYSIHFIIIYPPLLDITQVPVKFWRHNTKYLTPQSKSDCCKTSIVRAGQILGSAGINDKVYYTWLCTFTYRHCSLIILAFLSFILDRLCLHAFLCFFVSYDVALYLYILSLCYCAMVSVCLHIWLLVYWIIRHDVDCCTHTFFYIFIYKFCFVHTSLSI